MMSEKHPITQGIGYVRKLSKHQKKHDVFFVETELVFNVIEGKEVTDKISVLAGGKIRELLISVEKKGGDISKALPINTLVNLKYEGLRAKAAKKYISYRGFLIDVSPCI